MSKRGSFSRGFWRPRAGGKGVVDGGAAIALGLDLTLRDMSGGKLSLDEAYARVKDGDVWLVGADIAEYPQATLWNHAPKRPRKLLLHKKSTSKVLIQRLVSLNRHTMP